jgi:hypothetical protein
MFFVRQWFQTVPKRRVLIRLSSYQGRALGFTTAGKVCHLLFRAFLSLTSADAYMANTRIEYDHCTMKAYALAFEAF